ncbi:MotA/TolQ/ExbB proton channel family protein [bacterium]|nr:MotA/TolQ/ExbB proton channel family protein [bacterium]
MNSFNKRENFVFGVVFLLAMILSMPTFAQTEYKISLAGLKRRIHKNLLGVPSKVDYVLSWDVYVKYSNQSKFEPGDFREIPLYRVYCSEDRFFSTPKVHEVKDVNYVSYKGLEAGVKYYFRIDGFQDNKLVVQSDTAWVVTGRPMILAGTQGATNPWHWYFPLNGRLPLAFLKKGGVFDRATILGKMVFHAIWWSFLIGLVIWGFCIKNLSLSAIFPLKPFSIRSSISFINYDKPYNERLRDEFKKITEEWRKLILRTNKEILKESALSEKTNGNFVDINALQQKNAAWWVEVGVKEIDKLTNKIKKLNWEEIPTVRIIRAGLANHQANGIRLLESSAEVDRAIENRASAELEQLKRKSRLDWLWNLGTTAPLLGLFGTVTGISVAFEKIAVAERTSVKFLAGGINEALWTTILGLTVGIFLIILYYWYRNKLEWIYGKWEDIYVKISEWL